MRPSSTLPKDKSAKSVDGNRLHTLSKREEAVLELAARGYLDKEISSQIGVSLNTLRSYWRRIRTKLGEGTRLALCSAYLEAESLRGVPLAGEDPASFEIDPQAWTVRYFERYISDMLGLRTGELVDYDRVLAQVHPDDAPRARAVIAFSKEHYMPSFAFRVRLAGKRGVVVTTAFVEVVRDREGKTLLLRARRIPILDLSHEPGEVAVGAYRRDLRTNAVEADEACRKIYVLSEHEDNVRAAMISRYHPDDQARAQEFVDDMKRERNPRMIRTFRFATGMPFRFATADARLSFENRVATQASITIVAYR